MYNKEKAKVVKEIVITKENIDKALHMNSNKEISFQECMDMVNKANERLNNAMEAYDRLSEADREKELHDGYDKVDSRKCSVCGRPISRDESCCDESDEFDEER